MAPLNVLAGKIFFNAHMYCIPQALLVHKAMACQSKQLCIFFVNYWKLQRKSFSFKSSSETSNSPLIDAKATKTLATLTVQIALVMTGKYRKIYSVAFRFTHLKLPVGIVLLPFPPTCLFLAMICVTRRCNWAPKISYGILKPTVSFRSTHWKRKLPSSGGILEVLHGSHTKPHKRSQLRSQVVSLCFKDSNFSSGDFH